MKDITLPVGVHRLEPQRLNEILSGYEEYPMLNLFEIRALAYEVRNWRMAYEAHVERERSQNCNGGW